MKTLGSEMTTLFAFFEIAFGPTKRVSMRNDEKFCIIRTLPTVKNTTTESLTTKLLYMLQLFLFLRNLLWINMLHLVTDPFPIWTSFQRF